MGRVGSHINTKLADGRVIAASVEARRQVAVGVLKVGRPFGLLGFRLADTHLHAVLAEDHERATEFARRVELSIQARLRPRVRFDHVWVEPVRSQSHLRRSFFYTMRQEEHHGTLVDPLFEASNLPDLLGARVLGTWTATNLREHLPRVGREELEELLPFRPVEALHGGLPFLADAAAAAVGAAEVGSRHPRIFEAKRAAAHVAAQFAPASEIAAALGRSTRTIRWFLQEPPALDLERAVREQLSWRIAWAALEGARKAG